MVVYSCLNAGQTKSRPGCARKVKRKATEAVEARTGLSNAALAALTRNKDVLLRDLSTLVISECVQRITNKENYVFLYKLRAEDFVFPLRTHLRLTE